MFLQNTSLKISIEHRNLNTINKQNLLKSSSTPLIRFKILSTKEPYFSIENLSHFDNTEAVIKNSLAVLDYEKVFFYLKIFFLFFVFFIRLKNGIFL